MFKNTHIHIHTPTCTHIHTPTCTHTHIHTHINTYAHTDMHTHMHTHTSDISIQIQTGLPNDIHNQDSHQDDTHCSNHSPNDHTHNQCQCCWSAYSDRKCSPHPLVTCIQAHHNLAMCSPTCYEYKRITCFIPSHLDTIGHHHC